MDFFERVWAKISDTYSEYKKMPKPETRRIGGTYYGGTQLFSSVGNHLDLLDDVPHTSYFYGGKIDYPSLWGIRLGGAYDTSLVNELMKYIRSNKEELTQEGFVIIEDIGTNFGTYGIATR